MTLPPAAEHPVLDSLRAGARLSAIVLASLVLMPPQWLFMRFHRGRAAFVLPRWWFACLRRALSIKVIVEGTPRDTGGTLFVGNHISHFDIVVLGSLLRARFIAKNEMERWPGMRAVGELAQTLYISRRRSDAASVAASVAAQMRDDHDLVLFAEGTTSSGERVAPFKSSLFSLFMGERSAGQAWTVQPFTLEILAVDGRQLGDGGDRDGYAFHGEMDAGAHVKRFLRMRGAQLRVVFHPPMTVPPGMDRKALAAHVHAQVVSGLEITTI
ncbi:MAG TPA: lysophospholipid acyltransferase family protein [Dyella sp.]|nr:lysophospholipid acyltransferase family protein [Dyella sp.]